MQDPVGDSVWRFLVDHHGEIGFGIEGPALVEQRVELEDERAVLVAVARVCEVDELVRVAAFRVLVDPLVVRAARVESLRAL